MAWYIRKAFSSGPIRFNLSKSGLGLSLGVTGARVGLSPRGMYTHLGRHGLYYRSGYYGSSKKPSISKAKVSVTEPIASRSGTGAMFNDTQISYKNVKLNIELRRSNVKEIVCFILFGIFIMIAQFLYSDFKVLSAFCLISGLGFLSTALYVSIKHSVKMTESDTLYKSIINRVLSRNSEGDISINTEELCTTIDVSKVQGEYLRHALIRFYVKYLDEILSNVRISEQESKGLELIEKALITLNVDRSELQRIKKWGFNRAYLEVIEDKFLSKEEEEGIRQVKRILLLTDEDVVEEMETLNVLHEVRSINEGQLMPIGADVQLADDELCYHRTRGRIIK